jgi:DNA-binding response OmpR family regulator
MRPLAVRRVRIPVDEAIATGLRPTILIVTADADLRSAAARALESRGYEVLDAAHSGHAMLKCLTAGRLDAVVAELSMDDTSGPALAGRLRRHHPDLNALYFAASGTPECENVLVRPFTRDDLLSRVEAMTAAPARA